MVLVMAQQRMMYILSPIEPIAGILFFRQNVEAGKVVALQGREINL
jgi:hypothetical protein